MEIKPFTKEEKKMVWVVALLLFILAFCNFQASLRKARDFQRKADVNSIVGALERYHEDFGFYPASKDGQIVLCEKEGGSEILKNASSTLSLEEKMLLAFSPCDWGKDSFRDVYDTSYPAYLEILPQDPDGDDGVSYLYTSNTQFFQLYGSLEGKKEPEFKEGIESLGLMCGNSVCNFGKTLNEVPLDKSLEEYQNELSTSLVE